MHPVFQKIIDLLLPPRCLKCGKILGTGGGLCPDCFNEITFIAKPYCSRCGNPLPAQARGREMLCGHCLADSRSPFRLSRSAVYYDEYSKPLILNFKFRDHTENASLLARWMWLGGKDIFAAGVDVIVPIPLHYTRLIKQRYNQSALLAGELGRLCGVPVDVRAVVRHRKTKPQVEFSGHERVKNVKNAFSVKYPAVLKGRRVLLLDDVMTTGSTLRECAKAILKAGAVSVDALTVARVIK